MAINPDCTPGWAVKAPDGSFTAHCGCDWSEAGFPSRRQALIAQKAHRFPEPAADPLHLRCGCVVRQEAEGVALLKTCEQHRTLVAAVLDGPFSIAPPPPRAAG